MQTPALDVLRRACPMAHISALGARPAIELLENDSRVDELIGAQDWGLTHWGDAGTLKIRQAIEEWAVQASFDVILDPCHAVIAARDVLREQRTMILDTGQEAQNEALQYQRGGVAAIHAATLKTWGLTSVGKPCPRLYLPPANLRFAEQFFLDNGLGSSLLAISPVASSGLKQWPIRRLAAVADATVEKYGCKLLLICGPQSDRVSKFLNRCRHAERIVIVGSLHLQQVAALLARCVALIGNDTGLMHVAAAVGVPIVALFGPTSPLIYLPPGATSVSANVECRHRKTTAFGPPDCVIAGHCLIADQSCINQIDGVTVLTAIDAIVGAKLQSDRRSRARECGGSRTIDIPPPALR